MRLTFLWTDVEGHTPGYLTAYEQGVPLPAANAAKEIYAMAARSVCPTKTSPCCIASINDEDPD